MAITGENFKRINGNAEIKKLRDKIQEAKEIFWNYLKQLNYDEKALNLEKQIEIAEYELWCAEYEDNRKRNWK